MKKHLLLVILTSFSVLSMYAFENGILPGLFTVHSNGMQVRFSQGNLQYGDAGTHVADDGNELAGTWRFAATQYESIGYKTVDNGNGTYSFSVDKKDGFRDMFHWASSGYKGVGPDYDVESNTHSFASPILKRPPVRQNYFVFLPQVPLHSTYLLVITSHTFPFSNQELTFILAFDIARHPPPTRTEENKTKQLLSYI